MIYNGQVLRSLPVNLSKLVCEGTKLTNLQGKGILKLTILWENAKIKSTNLHKYGVLKLTILWKNGILKSTNLQ